MKKTAIERFAEKVEQADECWEWRGARSDNGYGTFWNGQRTVLVHRWSYEHHVGPIPEGLTIDHLCRNRLCVNPAHLEPVTFTENIRRRQRLITHCKSGHEFTPENTYVLHPKNGRQCRTCRRIAGVRNYWKRKNK